VSLLASHTYTNEIIGSVKLSRSLPSVVHHVCSTCLCARQLAPCEFAVAIMVWTGRKGNINENCLCVTVLCTIIMVHKDTSSSYKSVDCIGL